MRLLDKLVRWKNRRRAARALKRMIALVAAKDIDGLAALCAEEGMVVTLTDCDGRQVLTATDPADGVELLKAERRTNGGGNAI